MYQDPFAAELKELHATAKAQGQARDAERAADESRIANVTCPQCRQPFTLHWNDYFGRKITLEIRGCPSGGIYDVSIRCPHCNYEEEL